MTQYIRITKGRNWYSDLETGIIPVDATLETPEHYRTSESAVIHKSDCEPFEFAPLQEDQHMITTEQERFLRIAYNSFIEHGEHVTASNFKAAFPSVFQPARTYKIGDRFQAEESEWLLGATAGGNAFLIDVNHGDVFAAPFQVENVEKITAKEFEAICYYKPEQFTLLPDSTDQMV